MTEEEIQLDAEQEASWQKRKDMWMKIMNGSCYEMQGGDFPVWDISCLQNLARELFNAAQETVCINGKEILVYRDLSHWIEVKTQSTKELI